MDHRIITYVSVAALSVLLSGIIIPKILLIAFRKKLFDKPDPRKIHKGTVPRLGGFAFTPVVIFAMSFIIGICCVFDYSLYNDLTSFSGVTITMGLCALLMVYLVGMADDLIGVRYRAKFVVEILAAAMLIFGGLGIRNFDGLALIYHIPIWFGYPFTVLAVVFVINAINLIDGLDGLASGLSAIAFILYGIILATLHCYFYAALSFAVLGVLVPFYYFNVFGNADNQKKIFMGDAGSLTIGILIVFLGLKIWNITECKATLSEGGLPNYFIIALSPLIIPCFDVVRVFFHRIKNGDNPFMPDRNHIHHKLLATGLGQRTAMISIVCTSLFICLINTVLSFYINVNYILILDIAGLIIWNWCLNFQIARKSING